MIGEEIVLQSKDHSWGSTRVVAELSEGEVTLSVQVLGFSKEWEYDMHTAGVIQLTAKGAAALARLIHGS